jgi:zinc transport system ATP-binding protein
MSENPAIIVDKVCYTYGGRPAVDNASFTVEQGDFLGIIGPNGGGKTTLLRLMLGLLRPDTGDIRLFGAAPSKTRGRVGYIPQETNLNKSFPITVSDIILMGLTGLRGLGRRYKRSDRLKADILMERLALTPLKDRPVAQLSGGQRQKALLARAMVSDPEMLFLDEPTASVDVSGEDEIYDHLHLLNKTGVTVVLVTHNIGVLSRYVKSVACINRELYFHADGKLDQATVNKTFGCQVDLIAHGVPHRVFDGHCEGCTHV